MQTEQILMTTSEKATTAIKRLRLVNFQGGQAEDGEATLGTANADYSPGEQAGVNTHGSLLVEAGAAIAQGVQVQSDAQGRAITLASGVAAGRTRDAATAAGEIIRIMR